MKPTTISLLQKCKQEKKRFATITAYDYSFAKLFADEGINVMLVGDSLGIWQQPANACVILDIDRAAFVDLFVEAAEHYGRGGERA